MAHCNGSSDNNSNIRSNGRCSSIGSPRPPAHSFSGRPRCAADCAVAAGLREMFATRHFLCLRLSSPGTPAPNAQCQRGRPACRQQRSGDAVAVCKEEVLSPIERSRCRRLHEGKATWYVLMMALTAASGGLMFGYDNGVSGGVSAMNPFLKKFFPGTLASARI